MPWLRNYLEQILRISTFSITQKLFDCDPKQIRERRVGQDDIEGSIRLTRRSEKMKRYNSARLIPLNIVLQDTTDSYGISLVYFLSDDNKLRGQLQFLQSNYSNVRYALHVKVILSSDKYGDLRIKTHYLFLFLSAARLVSPSRLLLLLTNPSEILQGRQAKYAPLFHDIIVA